MKKQIIILSIALLAVAGLGATFILPKAVPPQKGDKAPELKYNTPEGKTDSLSALKGHIVLIDFWASWCGPCRMSNPHLVSVYNKYKDAKFVKAKGFTVFSVSLDTDHGRWVSAIAADGLSWSHHVSDLKGWKSAGAAKYGVNGIPSTFLVDEKGIIIGVNLTPELLDAELTARLKKKS